MTQFQSTQKHVDTLSLLQKNVSLKRPAFMSSFNTFNSLYLEVADLLNDLLCQGRGDNQYSTYFCNSSIEAIHSAVKISRHALTSGGVRASLITTILYDPENYYSYLFDQSLNDGKVLIPNFFRINKSSCFKKIYENEPVIVIYPLREILNIELDDILLAKKKNNIIKILDVSQTSDFEKQLGKINISNFDIVIWGKNLTHGLFPFGAISITSKIYSVWNSQNTYGLHTNTYGGNSIALSCVKEILQRTHHNILDNNLSISEQKYSKPKLPKKHFPPTGCINSYAVIPMLMITSHVVFEKASGSFLFLKNPLSKRILDCFGGSGCNYIGHNNEKFLFSVFQRFKEGIDYIQELQNLMFNRTGLPKIIQAVSGAEAVDNAIRIALTANSKNGKIIYFRGNFSGKSLISINLTSGDHTVFGPLYEDKIELDANKSSIIKDFEKAISNNDIAMVWFEFIQGRNLTALDIELIKVIDENRKKYNYLIGIDEILNGIYRTGSFLSSGNLIKPDIVTFSKALSASIFPISITLFSESVYNDAKSKNEDLVNMLESQFKSQLSAHFAFQLITYIEEENLSENVKSIEAYIKRNKNGLLKRSWNLKDIQTYGLHIKLDFHYNKFPFSLLGRKLSDTLISHVFFNKTGVLCVSNRLLPPLNISKEEVKILMNGIKTVSRYPRAGFFLLGLKLLFIERYLLFKANVHAKKKLKI
ncbi:MULTISPECIES: aminotransferase class III-fold pyridoxal phosphate-dependent enzyme [Sphingobacterium]|uniref:aminotransferase class III-fold pyridoxal phosphate-dependent enzyme n=1 Tax=Sphingobacterium TaxID=28453 RepID=UPI000B4910D5|nr:MULTISPECIES: aminotransferase class III-fold pyridoxal phosphate-dependent enzyme [Sphingobacterium]